MSKWVDFWDRWRDRLATPVESVGVVDNGRYQRREFIIIGLGRFGSSVAETLVKYGHDVLAIDCNIDRVQHLSEELPHVIQLDATKAEALHQIGIEQFSTGLVCISNDFESNLLATVHLLRAGLPRVITKARTHTQLTILQELGVHEVIIPEHDAGVHFARRLAHNNFIDYLEIKDGLSIVELIAPESVCGHTLVECNLRQRLGLTVIAVQRGEQIIPNPNADFRILSGDILMVLGQVEAAERLELAKLL